MTAGPAPAPAEQKGFRYAREVTAAVLAPYAVWVVGWSHPYVFDLTMAVIAVLALYEFLVLGQKKGYEIPIVLCLFICTFIIASFVLTYVSVEMGMFVALLFIPASYVFRRGNIDNALPSSAVAVFGTMYVGMLAGSCIRLRHDFVEGPKLVFFLLLTVWLGDTGAYYVGKKFGKRKLSPHISPKKTVEGLMGGIAASVITAVTIQMTFFGELPLIHAIIVGIVLSIAGVIGDLAESLWKRSAAVKDSGTLMPGHGGLLDRFDSVFFTAPILYVYWAFTKQGVLTLNIITG